VGGAPPETPNVAMGPRRRTAPETPNEAKNSGGGAPPGITRGAEHRAGGTRRYPFTLPAVSPETRYFCR
jgi:hypothetical protein